MQVRSPQIIGRVHGFSLVEVMVALLVISIGLLGIAKMQALALSNTSGARLRSLAAIEAQSLAATLQADRNYWGTIPTKTTASISGGTVSAASDNILSAPQNCLKPATGAGTPCTAQKMAGYDLQQWATDFNNVIGAKANGLAAISCTIATAKDPVSCMITINWTEAAVNGNAAEATGSNAALINPTLTLYVDP